MILFTTTRQQRATTSVAGSRQNRQVRKRQQHFYLCDVFLVFRQLTSNTHATTREKDRIEKEHFALVALCVIYTHFTIEVSN